MLSSVVSEVVEFLDNLTWFKSLHTWVDSLTEGMPLYYIGLAIILVGGIFAYFKVKE